MDILCINVDRGDELDKKTQIERALRLVKNALDEREKQIITMRYGLFGLKNAILKRKLLKSLTSLVPM